MKPLRSPEKEMTKGRFFADISARLERHDGTNFRAVTRCPVPAQT